MEPPAPVTMTDLPRMHASSNSVLGGTGSRPSRSARSTSRVRPPSRCRRLISASVGTVSTVTGRCRSEAPISRRRRLFADGSASSSVFTRIRVVERSSSGACTRASADRRAAHGVVVHERDELLAEVLRERRGDPGHRLRPRRRSRRGLRRPDARSSDCAQVTGCRPHINQGQGPEDGDRRHRQAAAT